MCGQGVVMFCVMHKSGVYCTKWWKAKINLWRRRSWRRRRRTGSLS